MKRNKDETKRYKKLERVFKGVANHRRIEILFLLEKHPGLSVDQIAQDSEVTFVTIAMHLHKLHYGGLVSKENKGKNVIHALTPYGKNIISLCKMI